MSGLGIEYALFKKVKLFTDKKVNENPSPFVTVFLARTVARKLKVAALLLILTIPLLVMLVIALLQNQVEFTEFNAFFAIPVLLFWSVSFLTICIGFVVSAFQSYRGSFKDLTDFKYHYRLAKSRTFSGDLIKCPKCGNEIRMIGELSSGECMTCGFEVCPKSARRKISKIPEYFSALEITELLNTGRKLLDAGEFLRAYYAFKSVTVRFPKNHEGWWGLICAKTEMFGRLPVAPIFRTWYSKAYELAPPDIRSTYKSTFEAWIAARGTAEK